MSDARDADSSKPATPRDAHDGPIVRVESKIGAIPADNWDACAVPALDARNPFLSHTFLAALEEAGCVSAETGWLPQHMVLAESPADDAPILGVMPCYLKSHSQGEYIFDHGWADAFERAGGRYYPKLLSAVPFTPVTGRRFLVGDEDPQVRETREDMLLAGAVQLCEKHGVSSFHANFVTEDEWQRMGAAGLLRRVDQQFHWQDDGYGDFDGFLDALASRKRKAIRKERRQALENDLEVRWITGSDLREEHWDAFYNFYMDTGARKWGRPYLNRDFFSLLGERMAKDVLLMLTFRDDRAVAGALNIIGGDTLYGRYWGCNEHHPCLHFELCYYQAIDYALAHGLTTVEAGAQGEHKLARGYVPKPTYSLHHLPNASFRRAVEEYLEGERDYVAQTIEILGQHTPFRKDETT
ncbi:MAG: GNAT family N-acetyltransferase [Pseudomonadota bacterium]